MAAGFRSLCIRILIIILICSRAKSQFLITPANNAEVIQNEVILFCAVSSIPDPYVEWLSFADEYDVNPILISRNENILHTPFVSHMSIRNRTEGNTASYNLVIHSLRLDLGSRYACRNALAQQSHHMYQVALASDPVCIVTPGLDRLVAGGTLHVTCIVTYYVSGTERERALWAPRMSWGGPNTENVTDESIPGSTTQSSIVLGLARAHNGHVYTLETYFSPPTTPPAGWASNPPHYTHLWSTGPLSVQFPATEVKISPRDSVMKEGGTLTCTSSGNPQPDISWVDEGDMSTVYGPEYTVPDYIEGGDNLMSLRCVATNTINGQDFSADSALQFKVAKRDTVDLPDESPTAGVGVIVGSIVGVILVFILVLGLFLLYKHRQKCHPSNNSNEQNRQNHDASALRQNNNQPNHQGEPPPYYETEYHESSNPKKKKVPTATLR